MKKLSLSVPKVCLEIWYIKTAVKEFFKKNYDN